MIILKESVFFSQPSNKFIVFFSLPFVKSKREKNFKKMTTTHKNLFIFIYKFVRYADFIVFISNYFKS